MRNSREKADWIADLESVKDQSIIISGDTIVALHGKILEKPKDQEDALRMLTSMSGQTHTVFSGMTLLQKCQDGQESSPPKVSTFVVSTDVTFKTLSEREIKGYIKTGEPMDKAGSYAIQGIGAYMVKSINGSFSNVIGMPLTELYQHLKDEFGLELHEGS
jgi:septum formation protein